MRVKPDLLWIKPKDLKPHPQNWRTHPESQKEVMSGVLAEIGFADSILAYDSKEYGGMVIIDGHLRAEMEPNIEVPVVVLDVDDEEARTILATHDPIAELAGLDDTITQDLLDLISTEDPAVQSLLDSLAARSDDWESDFGDLDNVEETDTGIMAKITITCDPDDHPQISEAIRKATKDFSGVLIV